MAFPTPAVLQKRGKRNAGPARIADPVSANGIADARERRKHRDAGQIAQLRQRVGRRLLCSANIQLPPGLRNDGIDGVFRDNVEIFRWRDFIAPFGGFEEDTITANQSRDDRRTNRNNENAPSGFRHGGLSLKSAETAAIAQKSSARQTT